jgi:cell division protein FtsN
MAVGFTVYIKGGESPFSAKSESAVIVESGNPIEIKKDAKADEAPTKDRFEYYNILPGNESKVTEQEIKQLENNTQAKETYFLQVGAFKTEQEADNVKAKLALLGLEAIIQTATTTDKGVLHRVRVGPYSDPSQLTKTRSDLVDNGFKPDLIKVNTSAQQ